MEISVFSRWMAGISVELIHVDALTTPASKLGDSLEVQCAPIRTFHLNCINYPNEVLPNIPVSFFRLFLFVCFRPFYSIYAPTLLHDIRYVI